jgi:hypothetical protein
MFAPGNADRQGDLAASYVKVGDLLMAQGSLVEALKSYRDGLADADCLAKADPENAVWQHNLAVLQQGRRRLMAQGDLGPRP